MRFEREDSLSKGKIILESPRDGARVADAVTTLHGNNRSGVNFYREWEGWPVVAGRSASEAAIESWRETVELPVTDRNAQSVHMARVCLESLGLEVALDETARTA